MPTSISFRLAAAECQALCERAAAGQTSPHELARDYVVAMLQRAGEPPAAPGGNDAELLEGLDVIFSLLLETRKDIALGVEALLVRAGRVNDQQATEWVQENYPAACSPSPTP